MGFRVWYHGIFLCQILFEKLVKKSSSVFECVFLVDRKTIEGEP